MLRCRRARLGRPLHPPADDSRPTRRPGGARSVVAESVLVKQQLLIVNPRLSANVKRETGSRTSASGSSAASFWTRCRSLRTSCGSSSSVRFATSRLTVTVSAVRSPPAPSTEERRDQWRWSGLRCVEPARVVGGRIASEDAPSHATDPRLSGQRRSTCPKEWERLRCERSGHVRTTTRARMQNSCGQLGGLHHEYRLQRAA